MFYGKDEHLQIAVKLGDEDFEERDFGGVSSWLRTEVGKIIFERSDVWKAYLDTLQYRIPWMAQVSEAGEVPDAWDGKNGEEDREWYNFALRDLQRVRYVAFDVNRI